MAVTPDPTPVEAQLRELLNCLCTALGAVGWEGDCCLEPGEVVWDTMCNDAAMEGKAWARLVQVYPSERFPAPSPPASLVKCGTALSMRVELGAIACVCWEVCDCDVREANAHLVLVMVKAALESVACCTPDGVDPEEVRLVQLDTVGPEGGSAGFVMELVVPTDVCCPSA